MLQPRGHMYRDKTISLVIPAYNEERLIGDTLDRVPALVDTVYVVDDVSPDNQNAVILGRAEQDPRIKLLKHTDNLGPGGAIITGYLQSNKDGHDISVVVGGDNQMPLEEIERFLDPIIDGKADYVKGNRFHGDNLEDTLDKMPKIRLFGNWLIAALTKIASGCYNIMDFVDGYTAVTSKAISTVNWKKAWKGYGYPMDFIIRMNAYGFRVMDVPRTAIYLPGERQSQIKGLQYICRVSPMLLRNFFWRLKFKYLYRNFHPLVLFFGTGFACVSLGLLGGLGLLFDKLLLDGAGVTPSRSILVTLLLLMGVQFILFAMLFDSEQKD